MAKERLRLDDPPSPSEPNGKDRRGRFAVGNKLGRGNPLAQQVQALRVALVGSVAAGDVEAVVKQLLREAKAGDVAATKVLLDRLLGPPVQADLIERIENLESAILGRRS
jgi:hypothetical protein